MKAHATPIKPPNIGCNMLKQGARSGLKAGMVTGAVFGLVAMPLNYFVLLYYSSEISRVLPAYTHLLGEYFNWALTAFLSSVLPGYFTALLIIFLVSTLLNYVTGYHVSPGLFFANEILNIGVLLVALPYSLARLFTSFS